MSPAVTHTKASPSLAGINTASTHRGRRGEGPARDGTARAAETRKDLHSGQARNIMFSDEEACPHNRHGPRSELQIARRLCRASSNNLNATEQRVSQRRLSPCGGDVGHKVDLPSRTL